MEQGSIDWLNYRLEGIGASDAPIIMGRSMYRSKLELFNEKHYKKINDGDDMSFIQEKGHRFEAWARPGIEFHTGLSWPASCAEHPQFPFIRASYDGYNASEVAAWECKFMGKDNWEKLADENRKIDERIPPEYYDQLMQQMFVGDLKYILFTGIKEVKDENDTRLKVTYTLRIDRTEAHDKYIKETLVPALFQFWKDVQEGKAPNPDKLDRLEVENEELKDLVNEYGVLYNRKKELEAKVKKEKDQILGDVPKDLEKLKATIKEHPGRNHSKMEIDGFKITLKRGAERVDYQEAFEALYGWLKTLKGGDASSVFQVVLNLPEEPDLKKYTYAGNSPFEIKLPKNFGEESEPAEPIETVKYEGNVLKEINEFKNPITNKKIRNWEKKNLEEKLKYINGQIKKAKEVEHENSFKDIADKINSAM